MSWFVMAWIALTAFYAGRFYQWWSVNILPARRLRRSLENRLGKDY